VVQALEAWDEFGEGANLSDVVHEPLGKLLVETVLRATLHWTSHSAEDDV